MAGQMPPLNGNFGTEEGEKPTHLKDKTNKKIAWSAQHNRKMTHLSPGSFERPGGGGDHTRAHQPLRPWPAASVYGFLASEKSKP